MEQLHTILHAVQERLDRRQCGHTLLPQCSEVVWHATSNKHANMQTNNKKSHSHSQWKGVCRPAGALHDMRRQTANKHQK
jgi:hypothetical protein